MLNKAIKLALAVLVMAGVYAAPLQAQDKAKEIRTQLEQRDKQIKTLLGTKKTLTAAEKDQLKKVVNDGIDFEAMGKAALGNLWADLTPAQRTDFVKVFGDIVRNQSLTNLDIYRSKVTYGDVHVNGNSGHAVTTVTYKEKPARVEYMLGFTGGKWHVTDIVLDGVSTAQGYAKSFQPVVRKKGFDTLMTSLRKKLNQQSAATASK